MIELEPLERSGNTVPAVRDDESFRLLPVQDSGVPLEMPFTSEDGRAEWQITAPQHRLSELSTQLEEFGGPFR